MSTLVILAVFLALLFVQGFLASHFGLRCFHYSRRFSTRTATEGDTVILTEVIRNKKPLFLPWLRIESNISPYLHFASDEEHDVRFDRFHKSVFTLPAFSQITRKNRVRLDHRGHYVLNQVSVSTGDLLGTMLVSEERSAPAEIYVYPKLLPAEDFPLPSTRYQGDVSVRRFIIDDPFLVNGIRAYRDGDPVRDIHWAATARVGALQVKTHDFTADPKLMVILNCQRTEKQWGELMDYEQGDIERGISLAASLCMRALRNGAEAGFASNMPLDDSTQCAYLAPVGGAGAADLILSAMASLRIKRLRRFPAFLEEMQRLHGMDVVIISCYTSPDIERHMEALRRAGNAVTLYLLEGGAEQHG